MAKFPNTLFKIVGFFAIADPSAGVGFAVFESLENEGTFFVQEVIQNKISRFVPFELEFSRTERYLDQVARVGDSPIYCFIDRADILIGNIQYIAETIQVKTLSGESLIEAAYMLDDAEVLLSALDERYFKLRDCHPKSAEFFRQNNVLRSFAVANLSSEALKALARDCQIRFLENRILLRFSENVSVEQKVLLEQVFTEQIRRSKSFPDVHSEPEFEFLPGAFDEILDLVEFDLPFSSRFLISEGAREIFVPIAVVPEICTSMLNKDGRVPTVSYESFHAEILEKLARFGFDLHKSLMGKIGEEFHPFNILRARQLAAVMMMVAKERQIPDWQRFGRIRCCTFSLRRFGDDGFRSSRSSRLLCINTVHNLFKKSSRSDIAFDSFFQVSYLGTVDKAIFSETEFGLPNKHLELMVMVMHNLAH